MSTQPAPIASPRWAERLAEKRTLVERALLALAALAAAIPIGLAIYHKQHAFGTVFFWGCSLAVICFGAALGSMSYRPEGVSLVDRMRILLMLTAGLAGLVTVVMGFALPFTSYYGKLAGDLASWRDNYDAVLATAGSIFGGLTLMFLALLLVRGMERTNQAIRWLVFGFNAVFSTLLLGSVLLLVNLLAYAEPIDRALGRAFTREFDWTRTQMYTLNDRTERFLSSLETPVKVYAVLPGEDLVSRDTVTLLRNCQARQNRLFSWELVNPLVAQNAARLSEMNKKYGFKEAGLLVLSGDEKQKHDHEFIPFRSLYEQQRGMHGRGSTLAYAGENALLAAMTTLVEGKVVVYFTQGHGEPSLDERMPMPGRRPSGETSLSQVKSRLTQDRSRFEIKPLPFDKSLKKIPDDAATVVIVRPTQSFLPDEVALLRDYMARKEEKDKDGVVKVALGRLMVMLDPVVQREGGTAKLVQSGLEEFLGGFGVKVGNDRVQSLRLTNPLLAVCLTNAESPCPVGFAFNASFREATRFTLENVRTIEPEEARAAGRFSIDPLLLAQREYFIYRETDFTRDPLAVAERLRGDRKLLSETISNVSLPVAVTVVEPAAPPGPGGPPPGSGRPRMIVFGAGAWIENKSLTGGQGNSMFDLFSSCLSWLRERGDIGKLVDPKTAPLYELNVPETERARLVWLPLGLMLLGVIALGTGVWVVRRR